MENNNDGYLKLACEITGVEVPLKKEQSPKLGLFNELLNFLPPNFKVGPELMTGLLGYQFNRDGGDYDPSF